MVKNLPFWSSFGLSFGVRAKLEFVSPCYCTIWAISNGDLNAVICLPAGNVVIYAGETNMAAGMRLSRSREVAKNDGVAVWRSVACYFIAEVPMRHNNMDSYNSEIISALRLVSNYVGNRMGRYRRVINQNKAFASKFSRNERRKIFVSTFHLVHLFLVKGFFTTSVFRDRYSQFA